MQIYDKKTIFYNERIKFCRLITAGVFISIVQRRFSGGYDFPQTHAKYLRKLMGFYIFAAV
jgi:hypothetical protein